MLSGPELLQFVKANPELATTALARQAGYVTTIAKGPNEGQERLLEKAFIKALVAAQGVQLKTGRAPGKTAQFETTVHRNGIVLLGKTYTEKFGVEPGAVLSIQIDDEGIHLIPADAAAPAKAKAAAPAAK